MRVLFTVQGEGRGHLTQALAVSRSLSRRGHELTGVVVGSPGHRALPDYFRHGIPAPVVELASPGFVIRANRSLDLPATIGRVVAGSSTFAASLRRLRSVVAALKPDLVVNFFEPLTGLAQVVRPLPAPVLSIAHQFMFLHPGYVWPRGSGFDRIGLRSFTALVGARSWKLALSWTPEVDRPGRRLVVGPPVLRPELFDHAPGDEGHNLIYLLNHGYAEEIEAWHRDHPTVVSHCFYDRPGAPSERRPLPNLTFHALDGARFLRLLAGARAMVGTAGFESVSEAAWLGKPVMVVPIRHHVEQRLNAAEAERVGFGISADRFDLDRLRELPPPVDNPGFRRWVARSDECLLRAIQLAAGSARGRRAAA